MEVCIQTGVPPCRMDADLPFFAVPFVGGSATAFPTLFTGLDSSFCLVGLYGCFCLTGGLLVALSLNLEACGAFFFSNLLAQGGFMVSLLFFSEEEGARL